MIRVAAIVSAALLASTPAHAQLQHARIDGTVVDASGAPVSNAVVTLADPLGAELRRAVTDAAGRFVIAGVATGRYTLSAGMRPAPSSYVPVVVASGLPVAVTLRLPPAFTDALVVEGSRALVAVASLTSIGGDSLDRAPARLRLHGLQDAVATLPGWASEDNGLLHSRGVDDGFLYVVDGVPVYERLDRTSAIAPDTATIDGITVVTGYVPPEFGFKSGGVIEVRTRSAEHRWRGVTSVAAGSDASFDTAVNAGGAIAANTRMWVGLGGQRSDRYLDPVHPDNLHNTGGGVSMAGQIESSRGAANRVHLHWSLGRARFDVPQTAGQDEAGQDQRQRLGQASLNVSWQRTWSASTVTQVAGYARRHSAALDPSAGDTPLTAESDRSLRRVGMLAGVSRQVGAHLVKAGVDAQTLRLDERFAFAVTDVDEADEAGISDAALAYTGENPFRFADVARPTLLSAYVQDAWQLNGRLSLAAGLRFDSTRLLLSRHQWSPRVGVAFRPSDRATLRASVGRFYQPPQAEHLLLSSSPAARELSPFADESRDGGAEIEPERQWSFEGGVEHRLTTALRLDVAYWRRSVREVADPNVFFGTTIIFPNAVAKGRAQGVDARLEYLPRGAWSGYANVSIGKTTQNGPITGGLFLEDDAGDIGPGEEFVPDHDQRVVAGGGATWTGWRGLTLTATARYESGTPIELDDDEEAEELAGRPGADLVDFAKGRVKPRVLVSIAGHVPVWRGDRATAHLRAAAVNVFDERYAYNFGNPFSGTHFGAPRTFSVGVKVETR